MGLREKKAQQSRERIILQAMALFKKYGYEETTMEAVADSAELSPSTLYRYFPTKDSIVLASFTANTGKFAEVFASQVPELGVERALSAAILSVLAIEDENPQQALLVRSILGQAPTARARLWDYLGEQRKQLTEQLAHHLNKPANDPAVMLTARIALDVLLTAADIWRTGKGAVSSLATAKQLMELLRSGRVLFPDPATSRSAKPRTAPSKL